MILRTNSEEAVAAAVASWGTSPQVFDRTPLELRIVIHAEGGRAPDPVFRAQGHLLSVVSDRHNFGTADLDRSFAYLVVSRETAGDVDRFRWFFLESVVYTMLIQKAVTPLHAACVERDGTGILLVGPSGSGKSTLSFACALRGWNFIADDASYLVNGGTYRTVAGRGGAVRLRADASLRFQQLAGRRAEIHPNGKRTIAVALAEFPGTCAVPHCLVDAVVVLRRGAARIALRSTSPEPVAQELLAAIGSYGEEVRGRHAAAIHALTARRTWTLTYQTLEDALTLLDGFVEHRRV
ncbi:MAG: hypothetical protein KGN36_18035 [Acidobacteriota bacterium]|nr:hypothetical protein [Acidobacteriota bacterium]